MRTSAGVPFDTHEAFVMGPKEAKDNSPQCSGGRRTYSTVQYVLYVLYILGWCALGTHAATTLHHPRQSFCLVFLGNEGLRHTLYDQRAAKGALPRNGIIQLPPHLHKPNPVPCRKGREENTKIAFSSRSPG